MASSTVPDCVWAAAGVRTFAERKAFLVESTRIDDAVVWVCRRKPHVRIVAREFTCVYENNGVFVCASQTLPWLNQMPPLCDAPCVIQPYAQGTRMHVVRVLAHILVISHRHLEWQVDPSRITREQAVLQLVRSWSEFPVSGAADIVVSKQNRVHAFADAVQTCADIQQYAREAHQPARVLCNGVYYTCTPHALWLRKRVRAVNKVAPLTREAVYATCMNLCAHRSRVCNDIVDGHQLFYACLSNTNPNPVEKYEAPMCVLHVWNVPVIPMKHASARAIAIEHAYDALCANKDVHVCVPNKHEALHALLRRVAYALPFVHILVHAIDVYAAAFVTMRSSAADASHFKSRFFKCVSVWKRWTSVKRFHFPRGYLRFGIQRYAHSLTLLHRTAGKCIVHTCRANVRKADDLYDNFEMDVLRKFIKRAAYAEPVFSKIVLPCAKTVL